jgi:hypothetical protein
MGVAHPWALGFWLRIKPLMRATSAAAAAAAAFSPTPTPIDHIETPALAPSPPACVQGGGGNPFDMGKLMESVKKAQQMVQVETQRVQQELER